MRITDRNGIGLPLSAGAVRRVVTAVLDGERVGPATVSVTVLSSAAMRGLNRRVFDRDRSTDVIAFGLPHPGRLVGDIYLCPAAARRLCRPDAFEAEELVRLLVHGTLHVLGYTHPEGTGRVGSPMWRRQEGYVRRQAERVR